MASTIDPTKGQASFCSICGMLLDTPDNDEIFCNCCGNQCTYADLPRESLSIVTSSTERSEPRWLERRNEGDNEEEQQRPIVQETCPKCGHGQASFYTIQMRSVDEGQTVFYTCLKCEHKWKLNN